jgi:hypothetical protein
MVLDLPQLPQTRTKPNNWIISIGKSYGASVHGVNTATIIFILVLPLLGPGLRTIVNLAVQADLKLYINNDSNEGQNQLHLKVFLLTTESNLLGRECRNLQLFKILIPSPVIKIEHFFLTFIYICERRSKLDPMGNKFPRKKTSQKLTV